jgi:hypothetical protein
MRRLRQGTNLGSQDGAARALLIHLLLTTVSIPPSRVCCRVRRWARAVLHERFAGVETANSRRRKHWEMERQAGGEPAGPGPGPPRCDLAGEQFAAAPACRNPVRASFPFRWAQLARDRPPQPGLANPERRPTVPFNSSREADVVSGHVLLCCPRRAFPNLPSMDVP